MRKITLVVIFVCVCIRLHAQTNIIATICGDGIQGLNGDGGPASNAELNKPEGLCLDRFGNLYIADVLNNRVRKIILSTHIITTIAGKDSVGFSGD